MLELLEKLIDSLAGQAVNVMAGAIIAYLVNQLREKKKENDALKLGMQALLRDRIIQAYNHYVVDKGWIPIYAKESINQCYVCYEALGENGVIDDLMKEINHLRNYNPKCHKEVEHETTSEHAEEGQ